MSACQQSFNIQQSVSKSDLPNIIYFNDDHSYTPDCSSELLKKLHCTWTCPKDWEELACEIKKDHRHLLFHIEMIERMAINVTDFLQAIETIRQFKNARPLTIFVLIRKNTLYQTVKKLKRLSITGIALDFRDWSVDEVAEGCTYFLRGEEWWPRHIIDKLSGKESSTKKKQQIQLTERQQDVAKLISQRGCSNKAIGKLLSISESTVKIHVSAILKAYAVRNRTQLALALDGKF